MPSKKKSAKKKSNKFTKTNVDVANAIKTLRKLDVELKKVKKDISHYPYNPAYGGKTCGTS
jgi:hypothetical protein